MPGQEFMTAFSLLVSDFLISLKFMPFAGSDLFYIFTGAFVITAVFRNLGWFRYKED